MNPELIEACKALREATWTTADGGCLPLDMSLWRWSEFIRAVCDAYDRSADSGRT